MKSEPTIGTVAMGDIRVTDEMIERACRVHNVGWSLWHEPQKKTARDVMKSAMKAALSTRPAQEPAAPEVRPPIGDQEWCQPGDIRKRQFLVTFDDPDCRNAVFDDETEARQFWAKACLNWNCYLFGALPVDQYAAPQPVLSQPEVKAETRIAELEGKLAEAIDTLKFYANPEIYKPHPHGPAFDRRDLSFSATSTLSTLIGGDA